MEQEEFIQKIQQHGSTLEDVITKIMDMVLCQDLVQVKMRNFSPF